MSDGKKYLRSSYKEGFILEADYAHWAPDVAGKRRRELAPCGVIGLELRQGGWFVGDLFQKVRNKAEVLGLLRHQGTGGSHVGGHDRIKNLRF